jgi:hypothetical protein
MNCAGCRREIEVGDRYIEDTAGGFIDKDTAPEINGLISEILGGANGKVFFCDDCTVEGGDYMFETYYGDEVDA